MADVAPTAAELRSGNRRRRTYEVLVVASSTGGPGALETVLGGLGQYFAAPILIVQHMMPAFTAEFTAWLDRSIGMPVEVARHGQKLLPGHVYLAPEDVHLRVVDKETIGLSSAPPCGYHRPSANVLFESAAEQFGARTLAVVLTGMGNDGTEGLRKIREAGGRILVQDEESCVVFGMPGAAIAAGLADSVVPLDDMAPRLRVLGRMTEIADLDESPTKEFPEPS